MWIKLLVGTVMVKRTGKLIFLSLIFLFGVIIGGVKTPEIIDYAKAIDDGDKTEKQETLKKPKLRLERLSQRIV